MSWDKVTACWKTPTDLDWTATSEEAGFEASSLVDGLDTTWWRATSSADQELIYDSGVGNVIDLDYLAIGAGHNLNTIGASITLQISSDASAYIDAVSIFLPSSDKSFIKEFTPDDFAAFIWTKDASNPVLDLGAATEWDDTLAANATVIKDGSTYKMWYTGFDGTSYRIGYATSPDGIAWTKDASNPVLDLGAATEWDDESISCPTVIKDGSTYKMWYTGFDGTSYRIGYATSPDGIAWTKDVSNPVLDLGAATEWDDEHITDPTVIKDGSVYKMWYSGYDGTSWRIGYATSPDGIAWTKDASNPVLDLGAATEWDDEHTSDPTVIKDGSTYKMWYSGHDGTSYRIGYATSPDGIAWTKDVSNPVLDLGAATEWDDAHVLEPTVIKDGSTYKMWYSGHEGTEQRIGYATSGVRAVKVKITGASAAANITLLYVGKKTVLDYAELYDPHRRKRKQIINITEGGRVAGASIKYTMREVNLKFKNADDTLYNKIDELWQDHGLKLFFVLWEPNQHLTEVWPVYADDADRNAPFTVSGVLRNEGLKLKGLYE